MKLSSVKLGRMISFCLHWTEWSIEQKETARRYGASVRFEIGIKQASSLLFL